MAKIKITFEYNDETGKRLINVDYTSDPDALAWEHEKEHARIVKELVGRGIISADESADVTFERGEPKNEYSATGEKAVKDEDSANRDREKNTDWTGPAAKGIRS